MRLSGPPCVALRWVQAAVILAACTSACFIRNCPMGGKRSLADMADVTHMRQCLGCGPGDSGQCVGPDICCGPMFGCYMRTAESAICERENEIMTPCHVTGDVCGADSQGVCVSDGLCCSEGVCAVDRSCSLKRSRLSADTLQYIRSLLLQPKDNMAARR